MAGDVGHDLLMGHAEAQIGALAVLEAEHVVAHQRPPPALAPQVGGMNGRQQKFLADAIHLFAHDPCDAVDRTLPEEEVRVNARAQLPDVSGADKEFMTGHFGVCRGLTERGDEELGPAMHSYLGYRVRGSGYSAPSSLSFPSVHLQFRKSHPLERLANLHE